MIGESRIHVAECESTQLLLDASFPEGAIATADHQTAGRGRRGARWHDVPGTSILCSVLLKPPPDRAARQLTLVGGLATAHTIERALGRTAQIKWPNDVLVDGCKVAGGLAELRGDAVVLGLGVNVNQTGDQLPSDAGTPAASLRTIDGRVRDRESLLAELLAALEDGYRAWLARGLAELHAEIEARDFLRGRRVSVDEAGGTALGITLDGALAIRGVDGVVTVESGAVAYES